MVQSLDIGLGGDVRFVNNSILQTVAIKGTIIRIVAITSPLIFYRILPKILQNLSIVRCNLGGDIRHTAVANFESVPIDNFVKPMMRWETPIN